MSMKRNGFTLVESLMAVLMFTMSGLAFSSFVTISASRQTQNKTKLSVTQARAQILGMLENHAVWTKNLSMAGVTPHPVFRDKTINPELACLRDGTPCTEKDTGYDLTLADQNGTIIVDAIDQSTGLTKDGAVCTGFSEATPNVNCPWRMSLKWKPSCAAGGSCLHPQVTIEVTVTAAPEFLQANNLSVTQVSMMLEQPKSIAPFARKIALITNSTHYGYPSDLTFDLKPYVVQSSPGALSFTLPKTTTMLGGTLSISGSMVTYSPTYSGAVPAGTEPIYGTDWFTYKIKDSYTGLETLATAYVQVMTPYTWTGLATGDSSISNKKNFCGKVVNGACDGTTFPAAFLNNTPDSNLVFNETCTNCNVDIGTPIQVASLETGPYFAGTITQRADVEAGNYGTAAYGWSTWRRQASFRFTSGTWNGHGGALVIPRQGEKYVCYGCLAPINTFFRLEGGTFNAPPVTHVIGSLYMPNPAAFKHNGGTFYWTGNVLWGSAECAGDCFIGDPAVTFWDLYTGLPKTARTDTSATLNGQTLGFGWGRRTYLQNGFKVAHNLTIANVANEAQLATKTGASIALYGDLIIPTLNNGGYYSYGVGAPSTINFVGTNDQTIYGQALSAAELADDTQASYNFVPTLVVNKPSGKMTIKDSVALYGNLDLQSAGPYVLQNVNLMPGGISSGDIENRYIDLKDRTINGFYFTGGGSRVNLASDITVTNMFQYSASGTAALRAKNYGGGLAVPNIHIKGDATFGPVANFSLDQWNRPVNLVFDGTGAQTVNSSMSVAGAIGDNFIINKPGLGLGNAITFNGNLGVMQDFIVQSGLAIFSPTFGISNINTGADGIRTRISLNSPNNERIPTITAYRTIEAVTPLHVDNMTLVSVGGWIGSNYSDLYGGATSQPIYVAKDLTFQLNNTLPGPAYSGGRMGSQQLILDGIGTTQNVSIMGPNVTGTKASLDLRVQNVGGTVNLKGNGPIGSLKIAAGSTVNLDSTQPLTSLNATVNGILNKNGTNPGGTQTTAGGGVINN